jgi:hypothetical protein
MLLTQPALNLSISGGVFFTVFLLVEQLLGWNVGVQAVDAQALPVHQVGTLSGAVITLNFWHELIFH